MDTSRIRERIAINPGDMDLDDVIELAAASLALYRAEQITDGLSESALPSDDAYKIEEEARAAWNAACAKWEKS